MLSCNLRKLITCALLSRCLGCKKAKMWSNKLSGMCCHKRPISSFVVILFGICNVQNMIFTRDRLNLFITVRNSSCGKVMFSQVCVKNSVHSGEVYTPPPWTHTPGQTPPGHTHPLGRHIPQADNPPPPIRRPLQRSGRPTGMHSCWRLFLPIITNWFQNGALQSKEVP